MAAEDWGSASDFDKQAFPIVALWGPAHTKNLSDVEHGKAAGRTTSARQKD